MPFDNTWYCDKCDEYFKDEDDFSSVSYTHLEIGNTLASSTNKPLISVSRLLSTNFPIAALPPGCAPL